MLVGWIVANLPHQVTIGLIGKQQDRDLEVLVQIGRAREGRERFTLAAGGWQHQRLGVASLDAGDEDGRDRGISHRLAEDDVAVGEVEADVFPRERDVAYAIALFGIELGLRNLAREVGCGARIQRARRKQPDHQNTRHTHLV